MELGASDWVLQGAACKPNCAGLFCWAWAVNSLGGFDGSQHFGGDLG